MANINISRLSLVEEEDDDDLSFHVDEWLEEVGKMGFDFFYLG